MKDITILKKAIEKVVKSGYEWQRYDNVGEIMMSFSNGLGGLAGTRYYEVIFSHDFLKAYFGEELINHETELRYWQYHGQQLVLEEEPLKYLEKLLKVK